MKAVTIRELHEKTRLLVHEARRLGGLIVTERGAPVARLVPLAPRRQANPFLNRTLLPGFARLVRSGKLGRGADSTRILSEDRAEASRLRGESDLKGSVRILGGLDDAEQAEL